MGLMLLNGISLQGQGLRLRIRDNKLNGRHLPHHQLNARTV